LSQLTGHKNQYAAGHGNELHARYHGSCIVADFLPWPHTSLYIDQTQHTVGLYWVHVHAGVQGIKITNELTRGGCALKFVGPGWLTSVGHGGKVLVILKDRVEN